MSFGDLLRVTSAICLSVACSTNVLADCPTRRFKNIDQEAHFLMRYSPIIFVGKVLKTRLIEKATETVPPVFEDEYVVEDTVRGSDLGSKIFLEVGTIGDGDAPPQDSKAYEAYIKYRAGLDLIVLTRGYVDRSGHYRLLATGDCPDISRANTPHGQDLVKAMKRQADQESR